jgi:hypothetical protein
MWAVAPEKELVEGRGEVVVVEEQEKNKRKKKKNMNERSNLRKTIELHTNRPKLNINCKEWRWEYCVLLSRLQLF